LATVTLLIVVPFAIYLLLGAVSPPTDFDVREYHLQGPKEWFQAGRITFLRHNVYTSFPFLTEMLSLTGMVLAEDWWSGALVGQIVLACFQLLSALAVFSIARRWISADVAWLATLIYLTTPWTLRISLIAYAEGALTFYLIASVMTALLIRDLPRQCVGHDVRLRRTRRMFDGDKIHGSDFSDSAHSGPARCSIAETCS
jgi:Zn-dependent protease with chaperone function